MSGTEYHKIQSVFMREGTSGPSGGKKKGKFIEGQFSLPEFDYLKNNIWVFTEKVDGTNIRVIWENLGHAGFHLRLGGKNDEAQISTALYDKLNQLFPYEKFKTLYPTTPMVLYGEGYGAKINNEGNSLYLPNGGLDFVLFDVSIGGLWLERPNVEDIGTKLGIRVVPIIGEGTIAQAVDLCRKGFKSQWGDFTAEGIVLRTKTNLLTRRGERIITKVKCKDFKVDVRANQGTSVPDVRANQDKV